MHLLLSRCAHEVSKSSLYELESNLIDVTTTVVGEGDFSSPSVGKLKLRANTGRLLYYTLHLYYTVSCTSIKVAGGQFSAAGKKTRRS